MNNASKINFANLLEDALTRPETFVQVISEHALPLNHEKFEILARTLETAGVVSKQLIKQLFVEKLGKEGGEFLTASLDISRPALFIEGASILGKMQFENAVDKLKEPIDKNVTELIVPAIKALAMMKPSDRIDDILVNFYFNHDDEVNLFSSIRYLLPRYETLVPKMLERYHKLNPDKRMWALKFLAETGHEKVLQLFSEELENAPLERGLYCISGIGKIRKPEAVAVLVKHMHHQEWFLRKRIAESLGQTLQKEAVAPLLEMIEDESIQVRAAALESLSKVGNLAPDLLLKKLQSANGHVKINLIRAMGQLKNELFLDSLIDELKDRTTLFFTIDALGDLGFAKAEQPLRRLLKDSEWFNRMNALEALTKLQLENIVSIAQECIQDENDMVRNSAARILASKQAVR